MGIHKKLTWLFLLIALAPLVLLGFSSYLIVKSSTRRLVLDHLESIASLQKDKVENFIQNNLSKLSLVTSRTQLRISLARYLQNSDPAELERMERILNDARDSTGAFKEISILSIGGIIIASTNPEYIGEDVSQTNSFTRGKQKGAADFFYLENGPSLFGYLSGPLFYRERLIGVVLIDIDIKKIFPILISYTALGETGDVLLVKRAPDGDALFLNPPRFGSTNRIDREIMEKTPTPIFYALSQKERILPDAVDYRGKPVVACTKYIDLTNWGLVVKRDAAEAFAPIHNLRNWLLLIGFLFFLGLILLSFYLARAVSSPVTHLIQMASSIGEGDLQARSKITSYDEIGLLSRTLNRMADNLIGARETLNQKIDELQTEIRLRRSVEGLLHNRLEMERRVAGISTDLLHLTDEPVEEKIQRSLNTIGDFTQADRAFMIFFNENRTRIDRVYEWTGKGVLPSSERLKDVAVESFHWFLEQLKKPDILQIPEVEELPAEAESEKRLWTQWGIRSVLSIPLLHEGALIGSMTVTSERRSVSWTPEDVGFLSMTGDILGNFILRKKAEFALVQSEERFRQLADNIDTVFFMYDPQFTETIYINPAYEKMWGRPLASIYENPRSFLENIHPEDRSNIAQKIESYVQGKAFGSKEYRIIRPDGRLRWIRDRVLPIRDETGTIYRITGLATDITDMKMIEEDLVSAKLQAEEANRAKSEFLANMSHEIRNPIGGIMLLSQVLVSENEDSGLRKKLSLIQDSAQSLLNIINDILDFSKVEAGKLDIRKEVFNPRDLMESVRRFHQVQADQKGLSFEVILPSTLPDLIIGDEARVSQVLKNLVGNAIKFTEQGGVTVTVEPVSEKAPLTLRFSVTDTGIGIPEDKRSLLFQSFSQVESAYPKKHPGTGLGLAISKRLVELMGGEIGVESREGEGSTFFFQLRFEVFEACPYDAEAECRREENILAPRALNILLAEDERLNRMSLQKLLTTAGHQVTGVSDGREALETLVRNKTFDLILMDVQMPEMDGLEATRRIRNEKNGRFDARIPIIALTAFAMEGDRERILQAGMDGYLSKPVDMKELHQTIDRVISQKIYSKNTDQGISESGSAFSREPLKPQ
ncbi:MAG: ATP-binding protein [Desulfococcaceae bacterium]